MQSFLEKLEKKLNLSPEICFGLIIVLMVLR